MAEPFKNLINVELLRVMGRHLRRASESFPQQKFVRRATSGLEELELKARVLHVADVLQQMLPDDFDEAASVIERSLAPPRNDTDLSKLVPCDEGLAGWALWPMSDFVARYGLQHPKRSLAALHAITQRHTAEYAIRPFLVEHEKLTMATLRRWVKDPNPHVRRLVSEGSRPRLPWGMQLKHLMADPSPTLPLLEKLQDDSSEYVRRSVANHLNDISKDHPTIVADWLERFLPGASKERTAMLRHASRTLIKKGDLRVLRAFGLGTPLRGSATLRVSPARAKVGDSVTLTAELSSTARTEQPLVVDYIVHHVKKDGSTRGKTWKGWKLQLAPGENRTITKKHSLRPVSTRRDYPGKHEVELVVNGKSVARSAFTLL